MKVGERQSMRGYAGVDQRMQFQGFGGDEFAARTDQNVSRQHEGNFRQADECFAK